MVTDRMKKFDELVFQELSKELRDKFPGAFFSLTQVHVSKDLSFAKIWVSSVNDAVTLVDKFNREAGNLRKGLSTKVIARRVPRLLFVVDDTDEKAGKIDQLLAQLKKKG